MSLSKLSVSLLALAGSAIAGDLPSITAKVSHFSSPDFPRLEREIRAEQLSKAIEQDDQQTSLRSAR